MARTSTIGPITTPAHEPRDKREGKQGKRGHQEQGDPGKRQRSQRQGHYAAAGEPARSLVDDLATRNAVHESSFRRLVY
jgi:hypothetical protein